MPESNDRIKRRLWQVAIAVATAAILFGGTLVKDHWAQTDEATDTNTEQDRKLSELEELAKATNAVALELAETHKAEDAAIKQDRKRCLAHQIKDRDICAAAGVELP